MSPRLQRCGGGWAGESKYRDGRKSIWRSKGIWLVCCYCYTQYSVTYLFESIVCGMYLWEYELVFIPFVFECKGTSRWKLSQPLVHCRLLVRPCKLKLTLPCTFSSMTSMRNSWSLCLYPWPLATSEYIKVEWGWEETGVGDRERERESIAAYACAFSRRRSPRLTLIDTIHCLTKC